MIDEKKFSIIFDSFARWIYFQRELISTVLEIGL